MKRASLLFVPALVWTVVAAGTCSACPMCLEAIKGRSDGGGDLPLAFYYSILFMLSMPFVLTGAFGVYFYVLHRQGLAAAHAREVGETASEPGAAPVFGMVMPQSATG